MKALLCHRPGSRLVRTFAEIPEVELILCSGKTANIGELCQKQLPEILFLEIYQQHSKLLEIIPGIKENLPEIRIFLFIGSKNKKLVGNARMAGADIITTTDASIDEIRQLIAYCSRHYRVYPS